MSAVFLLGAGFSKAVSTQMPDMKEMSEFLKGRFSHVPAIEHLADNVEHLMTYLSQSQPWLAEPDNLENRAAFLRLTREIGTILEEQTSEAVKEPCPQFLNTLVDYWHKVQATVITCNYDTLIERAVQHVETKPGSYLAPDNISPIPMPDPRRGSMIFGADQNPSFTLLKLHGSVNWYYSGASTYFGETIYRVRATKWGADNKNEMEAREAASDKARMIVPPTTEKVGYFQHEAIRLLWSKAGEALATANQLFCIGYSLPETDLSMRFFLKSLLPNETVLSIVNIDAGLSDHYQRLLGDKLKIDDRYVGPDALPRFAEELAGSGP